jgi:hypothetical protein
MPRRDLSAAAIANPRPIAISTPLPGSRTALALTPWIAKPTSFPFAAENKLVEHDVGCQRKREAGRRRSGAFSVSRVLLLDFAGGQDNASMASEIVVLSALAGNLTSRVGAVPAWGRPIFRTSPFRRDEFSRLPFPLAGVLAFGGRYRVFLTRIMGQSHRLKPFLRSSNSLVRVSSLCPALQVRRWRRYTVGMPVFYNRLAEQR